MKLPEKGLVASYKVAQLLGQRKKASSEGETIIAPGLAIVVETILGPVAAEKIKFLCQMTQCLAESKIYYPI